VAVLEDQSFAELKAFAPFTATIQFTQISFRIVGVIEANEVQLAGSMSPNGRRS
jgi:hypothetical protein